MISPTCCASTDRHFTLERAKTEMRRYRRRGPTGTARRILAMLREADARAMAVMDVGGGIGVMHHELLATGARSAVQVEASTAYIDVAREEAVRRAQSDRVTFVHGDAVNAVPGLPPADLVVLDRVLCCYPEFEPLVEVTAGRAIQYWAASYPRERWFIRLQMQWENSRREKAGNEFRSYLHPVDRVYALLAKAGLTPIRTHRGMFWEVVLCRRG